MINIKNDNIFSSNAEALVNPVNTVGVMGKGLALAFKQKFPKNFLVYREACRDGSLHIGTFLLSKETMKENSREYMIINLPTKVHWANPSSYEFIERSLEALKIAIRIYEIKSVALPALGCGCGLLSWERVKSLMTNILQDSDCDITIYTPYYI